MGSSFPICQGASRPWGQRAGGRWLEAKKCKRWRESPIFQGRVESGVRGKGPRVLAVAVGKGTGLCHATDTGAQPSPTTHYAPPGSSFTPLPDRGIS